MPSIGGSAIQGRGGARARRNGRPHQPWRPAARVIVRTLPGSRGHGHRGERADAHGRARRGSRRAAVPSWPRSSSRLDPPPWRRVDPEPEGFRGRPAAPTAARTRRRRGPRSSTTAMPLVRVDVPMPESPRRRWRGFPPGPRGRAGVALPGGQGGGEHASSTPTTSSFGEAAGPSVSRWRRRRRDQRSSGDRRRLPRLAARPRCGSRIHGRGPVARRQRHPLGDRADRRAAAAWSPAAAA